MCLANGIVKPAIDIHHKDSFLNYSGDKRIEVAFDADNLVAVCKQCHSWLHRNGTTHSLDITKEAKIIKEQMGYNK